MDPTVFSGRTVLIMKKIQKRVLYQKIIGLSPVDVIYMDLQKDFDSVPHKCLLYKIEHYGITGNLLRWIDGFLSNRRQRVVLYMAKNHVGNM